MTAGDKEKPRGARKLRAGAARRRKKSASTASAPGERGSSLSLFDLEIPVRSLLTHAEELRAGRRIKLCLNRLAQLLPRHPLGYRRFLARMGEVTGGGGLMFSWLSLRERMKADLAAALRALERAEGHLSKGPSTARSRESALRAFEQGVKVLLTYPLDPETVYQWSREVGAGTQPLGPLGDLPRARTVARILARVVQVLERERDELVLPNFRLVLKEVFRYHPQGMRRSDLFQEGILGLHRAVFRFDASRGIRFSTYATYWIRQSIRKSLIDKSRLIRVPQAIQEELRKNETSLSPAEADRVRRIMSETVLFSAGDSDDSDDRFSFEVKDSGRAEVGETLHTQRIPAVVHQALRKLNTRERDVLQRRFGLGGERPQTLEEIGAFMNLSRERIRQIEREALERMRRHRDLGEIYEDLDLVESAAAASRS
jgi:RNA polymerase sigma factor (sigma-70 family)